MKKIAEKYAHAMFLTGGVLFLSIVSLSVFLFFALRADQQAAASSEMLSRAAYEDSVSRFCDILEDGDVLLCYHYARQTSERAADAGEREAAVFFGHAADSIYADPGKISDILTAVRAYLNTGSFPVTAGRNEEDSEESSASVSAVRVQGAEKSVEKLFGKHNTLRLGTKNRNGALLYSCSNAYAVIDERSGMPIEAALSLPPAEIRLDADTCVQSALLFLRDYFPENIAAAASVRDIRADHASGTFEITLVSMNRSMILSVRRDTGTVVRLTTK